MLYDIVIILFVLRCPYKKPIKCECNMIVTSIKHNLTEVNTRRSTDLTMKTLYRNLEFRNVYRLASKIGGLLKHSRRNCQRSRDT